jgi:hypothetical protein
MKEIFILIMGAVVGYITAMCYNIYTHEHDDDDHNKDDYDDWDYDCC